MNHFHKTSVRLLLLSEMIRVKIFGLYQHPVRKNVDSTVLSPVHQRLKVNALMRAPSPRRDVLASGKIRICDQRRIAPTHNALSQRFDTVILAHISPSS
jgi:hypothetical protein